MEKEAKFKHSGLIYLLCIAFVFGAGILLSIIISSVASMEVADPQEVANRSWVGYISLFLSEFIFILAFFIIVLVSKNKEFYKSYKIKYKFDIKIFMAVMALGVVVMLCCLNITNLINYCFSFVSVIALNNQLPIPLSNFGQFLLAVLLLAVLPAVCEELVFRGVIYNGLRQRFSFKTTLLLSSLMFAFMHLSIYKTFYQIILGVILALLVFYTGTIAYGIVFHFINNFTIILLTYACGSNTIFEFSTWGAREVILSIIIFALGVLITVTFFKLLKKYTYKHKKYFELETTDQALDNSYDANESVTYEDQLINNSKRNEGMALLIISCAIMLVLWSFNSFGGFL